MLGLKLYDLIKNLTTSERKIIFIKSKKVNDKRYLQLLFLITPKKQNVDLFEKNLNKVKPLVSPKNASVKIANDSLRRFIDFAIKEIEDIKITNYTRENHKIRNFILSECYKGNETLNIQENYLNKLSKNLEQKRDYWLYDYYLLHSSNIILQSHTIKATKQWKDLLIQQKDHAHRYYLNKTSTLYDKISSLYLDNKESVNNLDKKIFSEESALELINSTEDEEVRSTLYLALAQFHFESETLFAYYSSQSLESLGNSKGIQQDSIRKKILLVKFLHSFHFGHANAELLQMIGQVVEINEKYKKEDPRDLFFLNLIQLISKEKNGKLNYFKSKNGSRRLSRNDEYFIKFLHALDLFLKNNLKEAKLILTSISSSSNYYIANWSRLIEITIQILQGNDRTIENLIQNELRKLRNNEGRIFTTNSSAAFLSVCCQKLNMKTPSYLKKAIGENHTLTPIHSLLVQRLINA